MWADGIQEFVEEHQLNPDHDRWDFRHILVPVHKKTVITTHRGPGLPTLPSPNASLANVLKILKCHLFVRLNLRLLMKTSNMF